MELIKKLIKGDRVIWVIFLFLCLISIIEVFSAASTLTYKSGNHWAPITQHVTILLVGVVVVMIIHRIQYKFFKAIPFFLVPFSTILLSFVSIMGIISGDRVNGASRWLSLMGIQFQPSELGKMAVVISTALILAKYQTKEGATGNAFRDILIVTLVICLPIAPENLSTAILLFGVTLLMMIIGRVPWKKLIKLFSIIALGAILLITTIFLAPKNSQIPFMHRFSTWKVRLQNFSNKSELPAAKFDIDKDAQIAHARIAIASSNIIGKMPGNSVERDFLSQAFSDFIFAIIIEELGLVGGVFVVALYIWLLIRAGKIAQKCKQTFPAFLVIGVALLLVSQAILNMMVAVGLFPVTGQPLPLISKGGSSTLINCAYIGIILSVSRYTNSLEEKEKLQKDIFIKENGSNLVSDNISEASTDINRNEEYEKNKNNN